MATSDESIEVDGSLRAVYNQWTQFETYRYFLEDVTSVARTGPTTTRWDIDARQGRRTFDADVTEDPVARRVTWASTAGPRYAGIVTLYRIDDSTTRVRLQTDVDVDGAGEQDRARPGGGRRPESDLDRFKRYVEASGDETGAWQGFVGGS